MWTKTATGLPGYANQMLGPLRQVPTAEQADLPTSTLRPATEVIIPSANEGTRQWITSSKTQEGV